MKSLEKSVLKGSLWTTGGYGMAQVLRFLNNVVLARLLAPELFGLMVLVNTLLMGLELFSDIGVGQSIVQNEKGNEADFLNTAWTLQIIRSIFLFLICGLLAPFVADFYEQSSLAPLIIASSANLLLTGITSTSISSLRRNLQQARLNVYGLTMQALGLGATIIWAIIDPSVWALVGGGLVGNTIRAVSSHFLIPNYRNRIVLKQAYIAEIINYGKWVFITSITVFLAQQTDRIVLGKLVPLDLLGVYGIARALSDIFRNLTLKLGNEIVFPYIARLTNLDHSQLRSQLAGSRQKFLWVALALLSIPVTFGDWAVQLLYDERYFAATWMVCVLCFGVWFAILSQIGDATMRGIGKPAYSAQANVVKLGLLMIGLPWSYKAFGIAGCIVITAVSELSGYLSLQYVLFRENLLFLKQDILTTTAFVLLVAVLVLLRSQLGFGTPWDNFFQS